MGAKTLEELRAYRATRQLKLEVYRLVRVSPNAGRDERFRSQIFDAAASAEMNVAEGFRRFAAGEFSQFLRIARGSIGETVGWLQDGIDRGHFKAADCATAFGLADDASRLITALIVSLRPYRGAPARPRK